MSDTIKCPDCGKLVAVGFPMHNCTPPIEKQLVPQAADTMQETGHSSMVERVTATYVMIERIDEIAHLDDNLNSDLLSEWEINFLMDLMAGLTFITAKQFFKVRDIYHKVMDKEVGSENKIDKGKAVLAEADRVLAGELSDCLRDWQGRTYVQGVAWTKTNEDRRAERVERLSSLLEWYNEKGFFTPKQREMAKRLVENVK